MNTRVGWKRKEGRQALRGGARRALAMTPFLLLALLVLGIAGRPLVVPLPADRDASPVIIATSKPLEPAFAALHDWNREEGCPSYVLTVRAGAFHGSPESQIAYVRSLCARWGMAGILLGGDAQQVPAEFPDGRALRGSPGSPLTWIRHVPAPAPPGPPLLGVPLRRATVRDLDEAWAFVDACRTHGQTLDEIVTSGLGGPMALAVSGGAGDGPRPYVGSSALLRAARP